MQEAISMKNMLQKKINDSVEIEKKRLEREKTRIINSHNIDHYTKVGSLTMALFVYCLIMTMLWLKDHNAPLKTIPEWFSARGENIQAIWNIIVDGYTGLYRLLEPHINDFIAQGISLVIVLSIIALVAYYGVWKGYIILKEKWETLWRHYDYQSKKLLKVSVTVSIITVSVPLAIFMVEAVPGLNIVSWWLILSIGLNGAYHTITYKEW